MLRSCAQSCQAKTRLLISYLNTDKFYFELFVFQFLILFGAALYSLANGNPLKASKGYDPDHQACGVDIGVEDYPYIYFPTPDQRYLYRSVCVSSCPMQIGNKQFNEFDCHPNSVVGSCKANASFFNQSLSIMVYDTFLYKENVCVPLTLEYYQAITPAVTPPFILKVIHDLNISRWICIGLGCSFAFIISVLVFYLIEQYYAQVMWTFIVGTLSGFAIGSIFYFQVAIQSHHQSITKQPTIPTMKVDGNYIENRTNLSNVPMNIFFGFGFFMLVTLGSVTLYQKFDSIKKLLMMLKITVKFLENPSNRLIRQFPLSLVIIFAIAFAINYILLIYLMSSFIVLEQPNMLPFEQLEPTFLQQVLILFTIVSFFWQNQFLVSCLEYVTSATISAWFGEIAGVQADNKLVYAKVAVRDLFKKLPQIAKASLFLALLTIPKILVDLIHDNINEMKNSQRKEKAQHFFRCCLSIYNDSLRSIEKVMFVEISKHNCSVDEAREHVKNTLQDESNQDEFEECATLAALFSLVARLFVVVFSILFAQIFFSSNHWIITMYSSKITTMVFGLIGFCVSSFYLQIYGLAGQTILYLFYQYKTLQTPQQFDNFKHQLKLHYKPIYEFVDLQERLKLERQLQQQQQPQQMQQQVQNR